jgi:general stress protein YciG
MEESSTKKSGTKVAKKSQFYREIGSKGGRVRAKQHKGSKEARGKASLEEAGQRRGQRVKRSIELGKKLEKD